VPCIRYIEEGIFLLIKGVIFTRFFARIAKSKPKKIQGPGRPQKRFKLFLYRDKRATAPHSSFKLRGSKVSISEIQALTQEEHTTQVPQKDSDDDEDSGGDSDNEGGASSPRKSSKKDGATKSSKDDAGKKKSSTPSVTSPKTTSPVFKSKIDGGTGGKRGSVHKAAPPKENQETAGFGSRALICYMHLKVRVPKKRTLTFRVESDRVRNEWIRAFLTSGVTLKDWDSAENETRDQKDTGF